MTDLIYILPSLLDFTNTFADRLTPPYSEEDASSEAQRSVLNNVRMAFVNGDQLPIPRATSAEGAVAHLIRNTATELSAVTRVVSAPFVGSFDLREQSEAASGANHSPFLLIEKDNEFGIGVYALKVDELEQYLDEDLALSLRSEFEPKGAIVIALTVEPSEEDDEIDQLYINSVNESGK